MNCINEEAIEKFVDCDLSEKDAEGIYSHLAECDTCMEKVMAAAASDKELLKMLTGSGRTLPRLPRREGCLNRKLLFGYVADCLNDGDKKLVESHLNECNSCVGDMMELQKNSLKDSEIAFDAKSLAAELRAGEKDRVLFIPLVVDFGRRIIEVIKDQCNGIVIGGQLTTVGVRGGRAIASEGVHIQKNFSDKGISVEVAIRAGDRPETCSIQLSIMSIKNDEIGPPVENGTVSLIGNSVQEKGATNKSGGIIFRDIPVGDCRIEYKENAIEVKMVVSDSL